MSPRNRTPDCSTAYEQQFLHAGGMSTTFAALAEPVPQWAEPAPLAARAEAAVKVYGRGGTEVRALDGVTVGFQARRFTAIMGPSGSGKTR